MLKRAVRSRDAEKDWHERSFRASGAIKGAKNLLTFSFFIFKPPVRSFKGLFDIFGPELNTILSVGTSLKYFRRKLFKFE